MSGLGRSTGEGIDYPLQNSWASLVAQLVKNLRPGFDPWVGKIPWRRERLPTPVFWPGEFHELYSSWGRKDSDMTEQLSLSLSFQYTCLENPMDREEPVRLQSTGSQRVRHNWATEQQRGSYYKLSGIYGILFLHPRVWQRTKVNISQKKKKFVLG